MAGDWRSLLYRNLMGSATMAHWGVRMEIPTDALSTDALQGIIEEFVSREGTDYGHDDIPLATKVRDVEAQLRRGALVLLYDPVTETVDLRRRDG